MTRAHWAERMMGMDDAVWDRHANPLSGWTRLSVLPLFALAVCSRVWLGWYALIPVGAVIVWTWLNPRLFAPPRSHAAWMTRGVLGERIWLNRARTPIPTHHARAALVLNIATGAGGVLYALGLWWLDAGVILAGLVGTMGGKLWFLDRMVWLYEDMAE